MTPEQVTNLANQILSEALAHLEDHLTVDNPLCYNPAYVHQRRSGGPNLPTS